MITVSIAPSVIGDQSYFDYVVRTVKYRGNNVYLGLGKIYDPSFESSMRWSLKIVAGRPRTRVILSGSILSYSF